MNPNQIHGVYIVGSNGRSYAIADAKPCEYFGKACLMGRAVGRDRYKWIEGTTVYIPFDKIEVVVVFENEEAWRTAMEKFKPPPTPPATPI